ncbi:MAG: beta-L-arabinofuranosidase domain-containing protein [Paludibacter sp.]
MRNFNVTILFIFLCMNTQLALTQNPQMEAYQRLPFGSIKPTAWLKIQMEKDMAGFVGNMDKLVPDLINDPIYGSSRLQKHSKAKDLGNLKEGDAEGEDQYKWWNSETQSNWWDGYIRNAVFLNDKIALEKVKKYIYSMLATQDADGYLGIYDKELRYKFNSENGELWAKTTLYRGLLVYYEFTRDPKVWPAIVKAVDNVMQNYPINQSQPFAVGTGFSGGVAHGLTFTDILDQMYHLTGERRYWDYALFLYRNFSENFSTEKDVQLKNILNPDYKFQSHGVHTYEHLRPLIVAVYASNNVELQKALSIYLARIARSTTVTGGPIGDEWIGERDADETHTGYEYCSIHELLDSYTVLLQKSGNSKVADLIENIFYNAAQGSRDPNHSCIAYLKTDNSYEMQGTKNGEIEPNRKQTRYKYSPVHQDVAVCCAPNAGRISPYFIQSSWFKEDEESLVASILCPNILETTIKNVGVKISEITEYPYSNKFLFKVELKEPVTFKLKIRIPEWADSIVTKVSYIIENGFIIIDRKFAKTNMINLEFRTTVRIKENLNQEKYFSYGALVFAKPFVANEIKGRVYAPEYEDIMYKPDNYTQYDFVKDNNATYANGKINLKLKNKSTNTNEQIELVSFGKTVLRQVTFK